MDKLSPIGVFDSGYGGLTVLKEFVKALPAYDYIYLGDNARAPYGSRSFDSVYEYTLQSVRWLLQQNCPLVILACNTASAKALRTIQQIDLPEIDSKKRVLGVIRPTVEIIGNYSTSGHIGILGTKGTIHSESYIIETQKFFPEAIIYQHACPLWVPLVENNEHESAGAAYFVEKDLDQLLSRSAEIDTVLLACTHYPLLMKTIEKFAPPGLKIIAQGQIIAESLRDYLSRHPEIKSACSENGTIRFFTTDSAGDFDRHSAVFFGRQVKSEHVDLLSHGDTA